jgi:ATP-binding cassette subfamily B protein
MVAKFYNRVIDRNKLRDYTTIGKEGANLYGRSDAAEKIGLRTLSVEIRFEKLVKEAPLPCIVNWEQNPFM